MRSILTCRDSRAIPTQLSLATRMEEWTSLGQHKRKPEFPVVSQQSHRNSKKTTWFPLHPRSEIVLSHVWGQMCRCHMGHIMQAPLRSEIRQWHPVDADLLITSSERLPVTKADCNLFPVKCGPDLGEKNNLYLNKLEYLDTK